MRDAYEIYGTKKDLEVDGTWINYPSWRIKIARAGGKNTEFIKVRDEIARKNDIANLSNEDTEVVESIYAEIYAKSIIKDWEVKKDNGTFERGLYLKDENGKINVVEPTPQNIMKCFSDLPDLFDDVVRKSGQIQTFQKDKDDEQVKN